MTGDEALRIAKPGGWELGYGTRGGHCVEGERIQELNDAHRTAEGDFYKCGE